MSAMKIGLPACEKITSCRQAKPRVPERWALMYDGDGRVALSSRLFTKPWSLVPSDSRKFSSSQEARR